MELDGVLTRESNESFQNLAIARVPQVAFSGDTSKKDLHTPVSLPFTVLATWDEEF